MLTFYYSDHLVEYDKNVETIEKFRDNNLSKLNGEKLRINSSSNLNETLVDLYSLLHGSNCHVKNITLNNDIDIPIGFLNEFVSNLEKSVELQNGLTLNNIADYCSKENKNLSFLHNNKVYSVFNDDNEIKITKEFDDVLFNNKIEFSITNQAELLNNKIVLPYYLSSHIVDYNPYLVSKTINNKMDYLIPEDVSLILNKIEKKGLSVEIDKLTPISYISLIENIDEMEKQVSRLLDSDIIYTGIYIGAEQTVIEDNCSEYLFNIPCSISDKFLSEAYTRGENRQIRHDHAVESTPDIDEKMLFAFESNQKRIKKDKGSKELSRS